MHHKSLVIIALFVCRFSVGIGQGAAVGAESAALGGICAVVQNPWSAAGNPAGLSGIGHLTLNTSLQQNYLMPEIGNYALSVTVPVRKATLGALFRHYGFASCLTETIGVAGGFKLSETFAAGTALYYFFNRTGETATSTHQVSYSLGLAVRLNDRIRFGFSAFNPFNTYFKSDPGAGLPATYMLGVCYSPSPSFNFLAEVRKDLDYPAVFMLASEFLARDRFSFRAGLSLFPACFSAGAGILVKKIKVEIAAYYHEYLGFTPSSSLQYTIK